MARAWLIDSKGFASKVKNATLSSSATQITNCGANRACPKCQHCIDNSDLVYEWPGFPLGVKFDPSDVELLEHLAAKCGVGNSKPHMFIDEFIPTVERDEGICYTHPECLPGAQKDGRSIHFFYKTSNAYATGRRKRRRIQGRDDLRNEHVRWHKTGKTKPITENGVTIGWKKIMVLYKSSKKGSKPRKSNWVMHQYHLGTEEDEKEGQYVVSKIYYQQQKQTEKDDPHGIEESDGGINIQAVPRTPKTTTPDPPRPGKSVSCDDQLDDPVVKSPQASGLNNHTSYPTSSSAQVKNETEFASWLAGESQAIDDAAGVDNSLLCDEIFEYCTPLGNNSVPYSGPFTSFAHNTCNMPGGQANNISCGVDDLSKIELDTPPDFDLADLQFASQDSILGWLDRI